ncbi:MAG: hypothetical protein ACFCVK_07290 [Acidimicrobiales bacterium]
MVEDLSVGNKFMAVALLPVLALVTVVVLAAAGAGPLVVAGLAGIGAVVSLGSAAAIARSTGRRLEAVVRASEALTGPGPWAVTEPGDDVGASDDPTTPDAARAAGAAATAGRDEIGRLAGNLAAVGPAVAAALTNERTAVAGHLGRGLAELTGVAGRLVDEQIGFIDWLEATEEDSDRLDQLYKLDHLATRLRRQLATISVVGGVAGLDSGRRIEPAPVIDVVRVAMGENEHYDRIVLRSFDEATVVGPAACDLAHLVSVLLADATASAGDGPVEVYAVALADRSCRITIVDQGPGMDTETLAAANRWLADPPPPGSPAEGAAGLIAAGRLARRLGVAATLDATPGSGATAEIMVPSSLVAGSPAGAGGAAGLAPSPGPDRPAPVDRTTPLADRLAAADHACSPGSDRSTVPPGRPPDRATGVAPTTPETAPAPNEPPTAPARRRRRSDAADAEAGTWTPPTVPGRNGSDGGAEDEPGRQAAAELGLTRRRRSTDRSGAAGTTNGPLARASARPPEEIRSMITRYRDGLRHPPPDGG